MGRPLQIDLALVAALALAGSPSMAQTAGNTDADAPGDVVLMAPSAQAVCNGRVVTPLYAEVLPARLQGSGARGQRIETVETTFSIDPEGRPYNIGAPSSAPDPSGGVVIIGRRVSPDDAIQASLAAWRFDGPARDCRLEVRFTPQSASAAPTETLLAYYAVTRTTGTPRDIVERRLAGPGSNCVGEARRARPQRLVAVPDFRIGSTLPGGYGWTVLRWDVDEDGRSRNVEILGSSGDDAFDAEARRAVGETLLHPGPALKGCVYNFYRYGGLLEAPERPPSPDDPLQACPAEIGDRYRPRANLTFPEVFRRRSIEGWAVIRFDLATWGQVGNAAIVDAQPAYIFGREALAIVSSGSADPSFTPGVRCTIPVRFLLPDETPDAP
ncbi:MAG: energy transducer TonB [Brevundimonas sp.]|uniref:energy transducer TonB n=1 Tax=Brevundimonas sp. TaxID=1871086 RepID=UPI00391CDC0A